MRLESSLRGDLVLLSAARGVFSPYRGIMATLDDINHGRWTLEPSDNLRALI